MASSTGRGSVRLLWLLTATKEEQAMAALDRDALLAALSEIGSDDDATAAEAGRAVAALLGDSGLAWADILVPDFEAVTAATATFAGDGDTEGASEPAATVAENADDALVLIEQLLTRDNLYEGTRDELLAYKEDIAAGEFDGGDLTYLNALYARVTLNPVRDNK
jgi:hypothetical protein